MWSLRRTASEFGTFFVNCDCSEYSRLIHKFFLRLLRSMSAVSATELDLTLAFSFASCVMRWSTVFLREFCEFCEFLFFAKFPEFFGVSGIVWVRDKCCVGVDVEVDVHVDVVCWCWWLMLVVTLLILTV